MIMNLGVLFLLLALVLLVGTLVARPFLSNREKSFRTKDQAFDSSAAHHRSSLLAEKERLLAAIQELEFDHTSGKVSDDDFSEQRSELIREASHVAGVLSHEFPGEIAQNNQEREPGSPTSNYDELEELIAKRRLQLNQKSTGFCPKCGKAVLESDRFCPKCGHTLKSVGS
jgi:hypothetical protein